MVRRRRPGLRRGIAIGALAFAVPVLALRLWMPFWDRLAVDGDVRLVVPLGGGLTVPLDAIGQVGLVGGGAAGLALAIWVSQLLRSYGGDNGSDRS